ncbi:MAG: hypothetical protein IJT95_02930 [Abditibacteriota bacterium]|nr:hypothetical protein [Abditibacteriota bacterium]
MKKLVLAILLVCAAGCCAFGDTDFSVLDYGAAGDGRTDCTEAFQKALDAAFAAGGGNVQVPTGSYDIKGNLVIRSGVFLVGTYQAAPTGKPDAPGQGSLLHAYAGRNRPGGRPFIELEGTNNGVKGLVIDYPENDDKTAPPAPYPPCIAGYKGNKQSVIDCMLLNPYEGIRLVGIGKNYIRNVSGYPAKRGIYIDKCLDISRVENCCFRPFGQAGASDPARGAWTGKFGVAFEFARSDWQYVYDCFCFGYGVGYKFSRSEAGCSNGNFLGLGADGCAVGIKVEAAQASGLLITNGEFAGRRGSRDSIGVEVLPSAAGKVSLMNCSFRGPLDTCISHRGPGYLSAIGCHFEDFGRKAVSLEAGSGIIEGNTFCPGPACVDIGPKAMGAVIMGNLAEESFIVKKPAGARNIQLLDNTPE